MASDRPSPPCCTGAWQVAQAMSRLPLRILSNIRAWPSATSAGSWGGIAPIGMTPQRERSWRSCASIAGGSPSGGVISSQPPSNAREATQIVPTRRVIAHLLLSAQRSGSDTDTWWRSEEHTSELQSHSDLVCRLLLEKKKNKTKQINNI